MDGVDVDVELIASLEWTKLAYIDPDNVDGRSCWIHVGARDYIANAASEKCDLDFDTKRYTYRSVLQDATQNRRHTLQSLVHVEGLEHQSKERSFMVL